MIDAVCFEYTCRRLIDLSRLIAGTSAWSAATERPGQSPGRLEEAMRDLQGAITGRRAAEEEALEAATQAHRAEGR